MESDDLPVIDLEKLDSTKINPDAEKTTENNKKPKYLKATRQDLNHPVIGGIKNVLPKGDCKNGTWILVAIEWREHSKKICTKELFGFWCVRYQYQCRYEYIATWLCTSTGLPEVVTKLSKWIIGSCHKYG